MSAERRGAGRWVGMAVLVLLAAVFAYLNAGERTALNIGFTVLYRVSTVWLVFAAFLLGMITMFLFSLRHDLRVRDALRRYGIENPAPEERASAPLPPPADPPYREPPPDPP